MDKERLIELFRLDTATGLLYWRVKKAAAVNPGDLAGCVSSAGYRHVSIDGKKVLCSRIIFCMTHGYMPEVVDHINCIRHDDRPENLRAANRAQNQWNQRAPSNSSSGFKGIRWNSRRKKWTAICMTNGRRHWLGSFKTLEEAVTAMADFRLKHHGDFARLA